VTHQTIMKRSSQQLISTYTFQKLLRNNFFSNATLTTPQFQSTSKRINKEKLIDAYAKSKLVCDNYEANAFVDPKGVFTNNEIDLKEIQVYGFDYDYTLAYYNVSLYKLLFDLARDSLVEHFKYPSELKKLEYIHTFPIRGLHLDKRKGWLMKIDSYHNIQMGNYNIFHSFSGEFDLRSCKSLYSSWLHLTKFSHQKNGQFLFGRFLSSSISSIVYKEIQTITLEL
jgi:hypothetical protein